MYVITFAFSSETKPFSTEKRRCVPDEPGQEVLSEVTLEQGSDVPIMYANELIPKKKKHLSVSYHLWQAQYHRLSLAPHSSAKRKTSVMSTPEERALAKKQMKVVTHYLCPLLTKPTLGTCQQMVRKILRAITLTPVPLQPHRRFFQYLRMAPDKTRWPRLPLQWLAPQQPPQCFPSLAKPLIDKRSIIPADLEIFLVIKGYFQRWLDSVNQQVIPAEKIKKYENLATSFILRVVTPR